MERSEQWNILQIDDSRGPCRRNGLANLPRSRCSSAASSRRCHHVEEEVSCCLLAALAGLTIGQLQGRLARRAFSRPHTETRPHLTLANSASATRIRFPPLPSLPSYSLSRPTRLAMRPTTFSCLWPPSESCPWSSTPSSVCQSSWDVTTTATGRATCRVRRPCLAPSPELTATCRDVPRPRA
jgi:hypothetical protein